MNVLCHSHQCVCVNKEFHCGHDLKEEKGADRTLHVMCMYIVSIIQNWAEMLKTCGHIHYIM